MLCDNDVKEELSYAYIHAVAAHAGFAVDRPGKDRDSTDIVVSAHGKIVPDAACWSPRLELQVKATEMATPSGEHFPFALPMKNYDDLRQEKRYSNILLIVYVMPRGRNLWLTHTPSGLIAREAAYWLNLKGMPSVQNTTSCTVNVPTRNHLTPASLLTIMQRISRYEEIGHGI